jgi:large subunit ribosomal protein L18
VWRLLWRNRNVKHEKRINRQRRRRQYRVSNRVKRDSTRPRLAVFRSHQHIYAQVIDDDQGRTLAAASTADKELRGQVAYGGNRAAAELVGKAIAERALASGVRQVAFDRREYKYHGRVAALADAARDAGLDLGAKQEPAEDTSKKAGAGRKKSKQEKAEEKRAAEAKKKKAESKGKKKS